MKKSLLCLLTLLAVFSVFAEEVINPGTVRGTAQRQGIPIYHRTN